MGRNVAMGEHLNKSMDKQVKKYMDELVNECLD